MRPQGELLVDVRGLGLQVADRQLFDGLSLEVGAGESVAIVGPSGSGKTTLLNVLAGIRRPDVGDVTVARRSLALLDDDARAAHRLREIGLLFQFGELLLELTVLENVALPSRMAGEPRAAADATAQSWLERAGVAELADIRPATLSGGEAQRVALARALALGPSVVLADEPTGALDEVNGHLVTSTLIELTRTNGCALVVVTHDPAVAAQADRTLRLREGVLQPVEAA